MVSSRIRIASANVRTLLPWQDEASYNRNAFTSLKSKTELLQMMFHGAGYGIVGIQEGRTTTKRLVVGNYFEMFAGACPESRYGSQVWVSNSLQFSADVFVQPCARITTVIGVAQALAAGLVVCSAHAPHE